MSALIINSVPVECINQAAIAYHIPATVLVAVLETENGLAGEANPNTNGTYDYGPMQINTVWVEKLQKYGVTRQQIQYNACVNIAVGAWILSQTIANTGSRWLGIGNYHSYTASLNEQYQLKVKSEYRYFMKYLT